MLSKAVALVKGHSTAGQQQVNSRAIPVILGITAKGRALQPALPAPQRPLTERKAEGNVRQVTDHVQALTPCSPTLPAAFISNQNLTQNF